MKIIIIIIIKVKYCESQTKSSLKSLKKLSATPLPLRQFRKTRGIILISFVSPITRIFKA
jgi:hypothetical protein